MLGGFAEVETNLRKERQLEGIADAKARGVYRGSKASIDPAKMRKMRLPSPKRSRSVGPLCIGRWVIKCLFDRDQHRNLPTMTKIKRVIGSANRHQIPIW